MLASGSAASAPAASLTAGARSIHSHSFAAFRRMARITSMVRLTVAFDTPSARRVSIKRSNTARLTALSSMPRRWRSSHRRCILSASKLALWAFSLSQRTAACSHVRRGFLPSFWVFQISALKRSWYSWAASFFVVPVDRRTRSPLGVVKRTHQTVLRR